MATVNGLTKERMLEIEAASIVNGAVDLSGHLILTNFAGEEIDAGNVKGDPFSVPDRLRPSGMEISDWNTAIEAGFYWSETGAANNPVGSIAVGQVLVKGGLSDTRIFQEVHYPSTNVDSRTISYRRVSIDGGSSWSAWASSLPNRLAADILGLGSGVDLNTVLESGRYVQRLTANATLGLNYPVALAGHLEVSASNNGAGWIVLQKYTTYLNDAIYQRTYYLGWGVWKRIDSYLPAPISQVSDGTAGTAISAAAAAWQSFGSTMPDVTFGALDRPLLVRADFGSQCTAITTANYGMVGLLFKDSAGNILIDPEEGDPSWQGGGLNQQFGFTAFSSVVANVKLHATKDFIIPAGPQCLFRIVCRRQTTANSPNMSYPALQVMPIRWM